MKILSIYCEICKQIIYRSIGRINESKKFGWKTYCSLECESIGKNKQQVLTCSNTSCKKTFKRQQGDIHGVTFCSRSCAATINNSLFPKRYAVRKNCKFCSKQFISREKYCSVGCKNQGKLISKEQIIEQIKSFHNEMGRIPLKREFNHTKAARDRFGTWNNAILAAGLSPNPVIFAKKHIAKDGHKCDSLAEKIIDDWLFARNILHERSVPYQKNNMTADFRVNEFLIEFLGLKGQLKKYDDSIEEKEKLWKDKNLKVIKIYPKDLFPKNNLENLLKF